MRVSRQMKKVPRRSAHHQRSQRRTPRRNPPTFRTIRKASETTASTDTLEGFRNQPIENADTAKLSLAVPIKALEEAYPSERRPALVQNVIAEFGKKQKPVNVLETLLCIVTATRDIINRQGLMAYKNLLSLENDVLSFLERVFPKTFIDRVIEIHLELHEDIDMVVISTLSAAEELRTIAVMSRILPSETGRGPFDQLLKKHSLTISDSRADQARNTLRDTPSLRSNVDDLDTLLQAAIIPDAMHAAVIERLLAHIPAKEVAD